VLTPEDKKKKKDKDYGEFLPSRNLEFSWRDKIS
jgi:hypothetical protein